MTPARILDRAMESARREEFSNRKPLFFIAHTRDSVIYLESNTFEEGIRDLAINERRLVKVELLANRNDIKSAWDVSRWAAEEIAWLIMDEVLPDEPRLRDFVEDHSAINSLLPAMA